MALLRTLTARRDLLVARCAQQRADIRAHLAPISSTVSAADRVLATVRANPLIAVGAAAVLALISPTRVWRWALRVLPIYSLLRG